MTIKPTTGPISTKPYQCSTCLYVQGESTNHWGQIYQHCQTCRKTTVWNCAEAMPKEYTKPEDWKLTKMEKFLKVLRSKD